MKKQIYLTICALPIIFCNCFGQLVFQKTYGGPEYEYVSEAHVTNDGGYIVVGETHSWQLNGDVFLLKTDSAGNTQWMKTYGGIHADGAGSVQQTVDGGYIVAGYINISNGQWSTKAYLIKTDSNGDTLWTKSYGSSSANVGAGFVAQTSDNGYIISTVADNGNFFSPQLMRTDSAGNLLWTRDFAGEFSHRVLETGDGGFVTVTSHQSGSSFLIKTNSNGILLWGKWFYNINSNEYVLNAIDKTNDGGFILAGSTNDGVSNGTNGCYIIKTDSLGDTLWTKAYQLFEHASAQSIRQTPDGGFIVAGFMTDSVSGNTSEFALKTDSAGNRIWARKYNVSVADAAYNMEEVPDGGFIIAGTTQNFGAGLYDIYLIKTDSAGKSGCNDSLLTPEVFIPFVIGGTSMASGIPAYTIGSPSAVISSIVPQQITICSSSVGIEENSFNDIKIFPNPFTTKISIAIERINIKQATFIVHDILGQTVFNKQENNLSSAYTKTIDLKFLSKGIYLLDVIVDGERTVKKIVKE